MEGRDGSFPRFPYKALLIILASRTLTTWVSFFTSEDTGAREPIRHHCMPVSDSGSETCGRMLDSESQTWV